MPAFELDSLHVAVASVGVGLSPFVFVVPTVPFAAVFEPDSIHVVVAIGLVGLDAVVGLVDAGLGTVPHRLRQRQVFLKLTMLPLKQKQKIG